MDDVFKTGIFSRFPITMIFPMDQWMQMLRRHCFQPHCSLFILSLKKESFYLNSGDSHFITSVIYPYFPRAFARSRTVILKCSSQRIVTVIRTDEKGWRSSRRDLISFQSQVMFASWHPVSQKRLRFLHFKNSSQNQMSLCCLLFSPKLKDDVIIIVEVITMCSLFSSGKKSCVRKIHTTWLALEIHFLFINIIWSAKFFPISSWDAWRELYLLPSSSSFFLLLQEKHLWLEFMFSISVSFFLCPTSRLSISFCHFSTVSFLHIFLLLCTQ